MQIANSKSFVAGSVMLIMAVRTILVNSGVPTALHNFNLVLLPAVSALCFCHAFEGRRPLLGRSEFHTSMLLGVLSLMLAAASTSLALRYGHKTFSLLTAAVFYAATAFYFREAVHERRSGAAENYN
jgi:hypothetical protein